MAASAPFMMPRNWVIFFCMVWSGPLVGKIKDCHGAVCITLSNTRHKPRHFPMVHRSNCQNYTVICENCMDIRG